MWLLQNKCEDGNFCQCRIKKQDRRRFSGFGMVSLLLGVLWLLAWEPIQADTYTDASDFYDRHEDEIVFVPEEDGDGTFYYGTKDRLAASTTGITYRTIGWRVTVKGSDGLTKDTLYYALEGSYLEMVHSEKIGRYEYSLYAVTLGELKSRMSSEAREALKKADCDVIFDACNIVNKDGVPQGGMTDAGIDWGSVYTKYEDMVSAESWSDATKLGLKQHYGKRIEGLFYTVTLSCGEGIEAVSGGGKYCYGTEVTIRATPKSNYSFAYWTGTYDTTEQEYSFILLDGNVNMTAYASSSYITITYHENILNSREREEVRHYSYGERGKKLWQCTWRRSGSHFKGWSTTKNGAVEFRGGQDITDAWLREQGPDIHLYAVWGTNRYTVVFDANGGKGTEKSYNGAYTGRLTTPKTGYTYKNATLIGWSYLPNATQPNFSCGQNLVYGTLAKAAGVLYEENATIRLYAVWDKAPVIVAGDIYVSLEDARMGVVTEQWLAARTEAYDAFDGDIAYGKNENNAFYLLDYSPLDFIHFKREGSVTETFYAVDSAGNEATKRICVHVVEPEILDYKDIYGSLRFISSRYWKNDAGEWIRPEDGGLSENSKWRNE